jgi:phosphoribosylformylglycinamidine cyclo-ligase
MTRATYKDAGVDRGTAENVKDAIKEIARESFSKNVLKEIGLFSGFFSLDGWGYKKPVLVSSIDGVGTKIKIAQMMGQYRTIGEDLVHHCVNDIMVCGADPLFFLDYIAADKLQPAVIKDIVSGIAKACKASNCALVGGETAEMPGVYVQNNFDLAGAIVGIVEQQAIIDGGDIQPGDVLIGVASNGLHTNGYSLARKILFELKKYNVSDFIVDFGTSLGQELLKVHRSYRSLITQVRNLPGMHGIAHVTGGGIVGNTTRLLKPDLDLRIRWNAWETPPIFKFIQKEGGVSDAEMRAVFNLGIGLVLVVDETRAETFLNVCYSNHEHANVIGSVVKKLA